MSVMLLERLDAALKALHESKMMFQNRADGLVLERELAEDAMKLLIDIRDTWTSVEGEVRRDLRDAINKIMGGGVK